MKQFSATLTVAVEGQEDKSFSSRGSTSGNPLTAVVQAVQTCKDEAWHWAWPLRKTQGGGFRLVLEVQADTSTQRFELVGEGDNTYVAIGGQAYAIAEDAACWAREQQLRPRPQRRGLFGLVGR